MADNFSTNRIYGGEKVFLTPEERAQMLRGASDQFATDITFLPRYLQEYLAPPTPLTRGEMRNPQPGTLESLRAENNQWDQFQQGQPEMYQQGRSLGTAGAVVADPLNYMAQAVPVVKGVGRLANMVAREATTPQGLRAMTNALTNQRGMFVPPTGEEMNALLRVAKGENVNKTNIFRAHGSKEDLDKIHKFSSWTPEEETAASYTKNPGYGGPNIRKVSIDLDKEKFLKIDEWDDLFDAIKDDEYFRSKFSNEFYNDYDELVVDDYKYKEDVINYLRGAPYPYRAFEEYKPVKEAILNTDYTFLKYEDDFPSGAKTIVPLRDIYLKDL